MSRLRLIPPIRFSSVPDIDQTAMNWAQQNNDLIEHLVNGNIEGSNVKDGSLTLSDIAAFPYQPYTPSWTAAGVAPALGNGTLTGRFYQIGKLVVCHADLTMGSTTTFGTGVYDLSLPATAGTIKYSGVTSAFDSSAGSIYLGFSRIDTTTKMAFWDTAQPAASVTNSVPFTWASGDILSADLIYEAA